MSYGHKKLFLLIKIILLRFFTRVRNLKYYVLLLQCLTLIFYYVSYREIEKSKIVFQVKNAQRLERLQHIHTGHPAHIFFFTKWTQEFTLYTTLLPSAPHSSQICLPSHVPHRISLISSHVEKNSVRSEGDASARMCSGSMKKSRTKLISSFKNK